MDKAELIRHEIEKRRVHNLAIGNPLFAAMAEEDIEILSFINSMQEEPVNEDLGDYITELSKQFPEVSFAKLSRIAVRVAKWKEEQIMAKAVDAMIGLPYENKDGGYTHLIDVSRPLPVGNNKIAIIFKKDEL